MTDVKDLDRLIEELESWAGGIRQMPELAADYQRLTQAANTLRSMGEEIERLRTLERELKAGCYGDLLQQLEDGAHIYSREAHEETQRILWQRKQENTKLREQLEEAHNARNYFQTVDERDRLKAALGELNEKRWLDCIVDPPCGDCVKCRGRQALTPQEVCEECGGIEKIYVSRARASGDLPDYEWIDCPSCQPQTPGDVIMGEGEDLCVCGHRRSDHLSHKDDCLVHDKKFGSCKHYCKEFRPKPTKDKDCEGE